jgi:hypothetical protein
MLDVSPRDGRPGEIVSWRLEIHNTGKCPLSEVVARLADGVALAEPAALPPGRRQIIRWSETLETDRQHLITVSACDPAGSRISEQIAARLASAQLADAPTLTVHEPTSALRQAPSSGSAASSEPAAAAPAIGRIYRPPSERPLKSAELEKGMGWKKESAALRATLSGDEHVYRIIMSNRGSAKGTPGLLSLTDRRIIFSPNDDTGAHWTFDAISSVDVVPGTLLTRLELRLESRSIEVFVVMFDKSGATEIARLLKEALSDAVTPGSGVAYKRPDHVEHSPAADPLTPAAAVVHVLERGDKVRTLRIRLSAEVHEVSYEVGAFRDNVKLDGRLMYRPWTPNALGYELALSDGEGVLSAVLKVALSASGQAIKDVTLSLDGTLIYSE